MTQISSIAGRTSSLLSGDRMLSALRRTQFDLLERQEQISTGVKINKPSDVPADSAAILLLQGKLEARQQHESNMVFATNLLNHTDLALGDAFNITLEGHDLALSQVGVTSTAEERQTQSEVVNAQLQAIIDAANRQTQGVSLFGGQRSTTDEPVFVQMLGGVRFTGSEKDLAFDVGLAQPLETSINGSGAFGALSARVRGQVDLNPQATSATKLADVNGAQGFGVRTGSITVSINGAPAVPVDLTDAETLGDVVTRVNNVIPGATGSLALTATGFDLTATGINTIAIGSLGSGSTAADLGIAITAASGTTPGADIDPRLTEQTQLAALGVAVDLTSGLRVTQGGQPTQTADFSTATTVQDLINTVDQLQLGLRMEVNAAGTGLDLVNEVSGLDLTIGENLGGTTASDLGVRSFDLSTQLSDFNHERGIHTENGNDDFAFHLHNGATFNVNIDGVTTVSELITTIQTAATTAGLTVGTPGTVGTDFNIGLAPQGNGLHFEDGTAGANDFRVEQLGLSLAATDLGIYTNAGVGSTITGQDVVPVRVESVFTHLIALRDALVNNDERGISFAGGSLESDLETLTRARAEVGVRSQQIEQQQKRAADMKLSEQVLLSELRDTDLTEAITAFTQLQQQLQASMLVGSQSLQLSLLDFLR